MKWQLACGLAVTIVASDGTLGPTNGVEPVKPVTTERHDPASDSDGPDALVPPRRPQFVREAQRALRDLGYSPGAIDGTVGPKTRAALARYQGAEKLPVTGELDAETLARLDVYRRLFRPRES